MDKIKVAVLGATGMIGQRFIEMLEDHQCPIFSFDLQMDDEKKE